METNLVKLEKHSDPHLLPAVIGITDTCHMQHKEPKSVEEYKKQLRPFCNTVDEKADKIEKKQEQELAASVGSELKNITEETRAIRQELAKLAQAVKLEIPASYQLTSSLEEKAVLEVTAASKAVLEESEQHYNIPE